MHLLTYFCVFTVSTYVISSLCKPDFGTTAQGAKSSPVKNLEPPKSGVIVKVVRNAQKRVVPEAKPSLKIGSPKRHLLELSWPIFVGIKLFCFSR